MAPLSTGILFALISLGVGASIFGSIVGLGGGFIVVPFLRLAFDFAPGVAAGTSLVLVFANTAAASIAFARRGRIAFRTAIPLALASIPGSIGGAILAHHLPAHTYDWLYAGLLVALSLYVFLRRDAGDSTRKTIANNDVWIMAAGGLVVGLVSSLFGIGGGVILIPLLFAMTEFDVHVVAATSTAVIAMTSPVGILTQGLLGDLALWPCLALGAGGIIGGSIGARLASKISARDLNGLIAAAMLLAAIAMVARHVF